MKLDARVLLPPLLAALVLFLTLRQTSEALRLSGAWQRRTAAVARPEDPYARLDVRIADPHPEVQTETLRDPFAYGPAPRPRVTPGPRTPRPAPPPVVEPERPVLTSITWSDDADPRATLRYNDRDYSVGVGSLFDEFTVRSITETRVVLMRDGQPVVLTLRSKGE